MRAQKGLKTKNANTKDAYDDNFLTNKNSKLGCAGHTQEFP
jgi:hypothetical protein